MLSTMPGTFASARGATKAVCADEASLRATVPAPADPRRPQTPAPASGPFAHSRAEEAALEPRQAASGPGLCVRQVPAVALGHVPASEPESERDASGACTRPGRGNPTGRDGGLGAGAVRSRAAPGAQRGRGGVCAAAGGDGTGGGGGHRLRIREAGAALSRAARPESVEAPRRSRPRRGPWRPVSPRRGERARAGGRSRREPLSVEDAGRRVFSPTGRRRRQRSVRGPGAAPRAPGSVPRARSAALPRAWPRARPAPSERVGGS